MPYIRPYSGGRFRVEVEKLGVRDSAIFPTKKQAKDWGIDREREIEAQRNGINVPFSEACRRYLAEVSVKKKAAVDWETKRLRAIAEFFGPGTPIQSISRSDIARWRDTRLETVKGSTVRRESNLLSNLFTVCRLEWGWIKESPMEGLKMPEAEQPREVVWRWQQIRRVLRYCQGSEGIKTQQVGIAFHISLRTAMRLKEVLIARKEGKLAVIDDSKTTVKGKRVTIPLTYQGARVMDRYGSVQWVIEPNEASVLFSEATLACGVRRRGSREGPTFHDARATALTSMAKTIPVQNLQRISRHRNITVLLGTYYRATNEEIATGLQRRAMSG